MNRGISEGDFASLKMLQNQIHKDIAFHLSCGISNAEINYPGNNELSKRNVDIQCAPFTSSSVSHDENYNTCIYVGMANNQIGKYEATQQQNMESALEILEFSTNSEDTINNAIVQISQPYNSALNNVIFVLDSLGWLHIVCTYTMLEIFVWNQEKVLEFILMEDDGDAQLNLLMVIERQNEKHQKLTDTYLQIREYPSFQLVYELKVNRFCIPLNCSIGQESPLIIEGSSYNELNESNDECSTNLTALRIRGICEGNAEIRLSRLLRRNKFEEAELCAKINRLDFEKIYQAKASWLLDKLSPWSASPDDCARLSDNSKYLKELRSTLKNMKNLDYMVRCCVSAALPSLKDTRNILLLARSAIQKNVNDNFDNDLLSSVSFTLQRLETFIYTHQLCLGNALTSMNTTSSIEIIEMWSSFCRADMLATIGKLLSQAKIDATLLVWQRHQAEFSEQLTSDQIRIILNLVKPEDMEWSCSDIRLEKIFQWMSVFIPDCLRMLPECLPIIADWATTATKRLELRDRKNWPANGLKLATFSLEAMHLSNGNTQGSFKLNSLQATRIPLALHQQRTDKTSNLYKLTNLIESLNDLRVLHCVLKIRIKLDDFVQDDKVEVCTQLLDWCTLSAEVESLLDKFLVSYIMRFGLNITDLLSDYCEKLITDTGFCWYWELGSTAPWEEKAATIINYLSDCPKTRSKLILSALKYAPVPWSSTVKTLCEEAYSLPNSGLVKEQEKLVDLKYVLRKYNCKSYNVVGREAEAILKKVIKNGGSHEEILVIANLLHGLNEITANKLYVQNLLESNSNNDQHNEAIRIVTMSPNNSLTVDEVLELANQFLVRAKLLYKYDFDANFANTNLKNDSENFGSSSYLLFLKGLLTNIKKEFSQTGRNRKKIQELEIRINEFANTCALRLKFGIQLEDACTVEEAENIINAKVTELVSEKLECQSIDLNAIYKKLQELVLLIKPLVSEITIEKVVSLVIVVLANKKKYDHAVDATKLLIGSKNALDADLTPANANTLMNLILLINGDIANTNDCAVAGNAYSYELPIIMKYLASNAVSHCNDENLIDNIFVSTWQALMSNISRQFHSKSVFDKFQDGARSDESSFIYENWKFAPLFVDKTLPLPDYSALMVPAKYMTMLFNQRTEALPYLPLTIFCNVHQIKVKDEASESKVENKLLQAPELLDSTSAVCSLTPPHNSTRIFMSPLHQQGPSTFSISSIEREETLNALTTDILRHCHIYLNPMNQTVLSLESLILAEKTLVWLNASYTHHGPSNSSSPNVLKFRDMVFQESLKVLPKILSDKKPDLLFALGLLLSDDDSKKGLKMLQKTNSSFSFDDADKINVLGRVGMWYCSKVNLVHQYMPFRKLFIQSAWANKLASMGGSYKDVFTTNTQDDKMRILKASVDKNDIKLESFGVNDVVQFSKAFEVDKNSALIFYVKSLLTSTLVEPRVEMDQASVARIKSDFDKNFSEHISAAFSTITDNNKNEIKLKLISELVFNEISPYNYEVMEFLLRSWKSILQQSIDENSIKEEEIDRECEAEHYEETFFFSKEIEKTLMSVIRFEKILDFISAYQRTEEPRSEEIDRWNEAKSGSSIPPVARLRLPFTHISEKSPKETFKFLMKEFKLINFSQWLKSANEEKYVFRASPNNICIQTAQNEIKILVENISKDSSALHHSNWIETLKGVEECLNCITDLFQATSVTHWIINRIPEDKGNERLFCARMCRKYAEGWKQQAGNHDQETEKGYNFAVTTQIRLEIEQILRKNDLLDDSKRQLLLEFQHLESSKIVQLITKLYEHPSIVERAQNVVDCRASHNRSGALEPVYHTRLYPNINEAVKEIAMTTNQAQNIFEINLDVLKYDILDVLLKEKLDSGSKNNCDDTITNFSLNLMPGKVSLQQEIENNEVEDSSNYLKCVYLLQGFENRKGLDYLLQIAMDKGLKTEGFDANVTTNQLCIATSNVSTMQKLRSLKCLLSVARQDELDQMGCGIFEEEHFIEKKFHNYGFVSRLESLNLPAYDLASFEQCDKTALIEGILRICSYSAEGKYLLYLIQTRHNNVIKSYYHCLKPNYINSIFRNFNNGRSMFSL